MMLAEIKEVSLSEPDGGRLWGRYIDLPKAGTTTEASAIDLMGWVLGKSSLAVAVEVMSEGTVVRRLPLNARRPDIAEAFPDVAKAEESGFKATVSALGTTRELELELQAVLKDQSRIPLGVIRGIRRWAEGEEERQSGMALVSVIIPCYNQARFLGEAIESVLAQTYPHFEVVVIDDGSTDNTSEVASRYPGVRCIRQENEGLAGARNAGIRHSRGSYLVFLDADDRLLPHALEVGLKHLKAHPECAFVSGHCRFTAVDGSPLPTPPQTPIEGDHYETLLRNTYIWSGATVMYRRAVFETAGIFDVSVGSSADYDLYLRIAREYPVHQHSEVVAEYRQHGTNMTPDPAVMLKAVVTILQGQRPYVRGKRQYKRAYKAGISSWRGHYGDPLVQEVQDRLWKRDWGAAVKGLLVLLQYYPYGVASVLRSCATSIKFTSLRSRKPAG
jgi:glycosyltransferase involved in cell wall biosynthesis